MKKSEHLKILIVKLSSFGDVVHTLPSFLFLRGSLPGARIDWLVEKKFAPLLGLVKGIDKVHTVDTFALRKKPFAPGTIREILKLRKILRSSGYDIVIDFQGLLKSAVFVKASGASVRVGFAKPYLKERSAARFYTHTVEPEIDKTNVVFKNLSLAKTVISSLGGWLPAFKIKINKTAVKTDCAGIFSPNPSAVKIMDGGLKKAGIRKFALLHTGTSNPNKLLPLEMQAELCDLLWTKKKLMPVLCGSGKDIENAKVVVSMCRDSRPFILRTSSLAQLAEAMKLASVFIGPDSGPLHLASAIGAKTIGYYGPTDPNRNGPLGKNVRVIEPKIPCRKPSCWKKCRSNLCLINLNVSDFLKFIK